MSEPRPADEFAVKYCSRCDSMAKHRIVSLITVHPGNYGRVCNARCSCGARAVVGMPPTPENMARLRAKWAGKATEEEAP